MKPAEARAVLLAQHDRLRASLGRCTVLASRLGQGEPLTQELDRELDQLRADFAEHNATEHSLIRPLLVDSPTWGALLVDRMLEEHAAEHTAFRQMLAGTAAEVAARMDDLVEELDAHMAAEERTFLSPQVLHHEVITRHRQEPT